MKAVRIYWRHATFHRVHRLAQEVLWLKYAQVGKDGFHSRKRCETSKKIILDRNSKNQFLGHYNSERRDCTVLCLLRICHAFSLLSTAGHLGFDRPPRT